MATIREPVRASKQCYSRFLLDALEQRALLSTTTAIPPFSGTASPGSATAPGPVLSTLTPTLQWNASTTSTAVTGIQINLFDRTHAKSMSYRVGATASSFTLPAGALANGDAYVWNLRYVAGSETGAPGTYLFFQAPALPALPVPVVISPGSTSSPGPVLTTTSPTFEWNAVTGVTGMTGYQLNLYDVTKSRSSSYRISPTATSFTVPAALEPGDAFIWNLRVVAGTRSGPPSAYLHFQTPKPATIPAPVIISPGSVTPPGPVLTTTTPTFQWNAVTGVSGMTGYQLNLYDATAVKSTSYSISPSATSFTLPAGVLTAGDQYVWNLRVVAGTRTGPPSAYFYFKAAPAAELPAPVITSPGSSTSPGPVLTTSTPTFQWNAVTGVAGMTGYQLNLYDATAAKSTSYTVGADATSFTLPSGVLVAGDHYVWNLRVLAGTRSGPPSNYLYFQAAPLPALPAPVITSPGSATAPGPVITTMTPTFQWNAVTGVAGMTGYQLNLYDKTKAKLTSYTVDASATSFTLPAGVLVAGDSYIWNLRIVVGTRTGPESNYLQFQAPPAPVVPSPVISSPGVASTAGVLVNTLMPTFLWTPITGVAGMTGYQLNLYDTTAKKFVSYQIDPSASSFTLTTALTSGDHYVWNLRLVLGTTTGPESNYLNFYV